MPSKTSIAATLIVRDEARCITRCLDSVRPWVDRMLVLDTGSVDETAVLARKCGAEVHHLPWPDDFSAARNHALALADADWNLVIDADEWIDEGGEALRAWCEDLSHGARLGAVCVHSEFDLARPGSEGVPIWRSWLPRLLPRGVRYEGRVHEQPVAALPVERLALHLAHDGYLGAQAERKQGRNTPLLHRDLQDRPNDPYILYQLGKDAESREDFAAASRWYGEAYPGTPRGANWRHSLLIRYFHCLGQSGGRAAALELAEREMANWLDSPDFFFVLGNLLLDNAMADPANAVGRWLPLAVTAWERCLTIGERPDLEGSVHGRGSHLARHNLNVIQSQMAALGG